MMVVIVTVAFSDNAAYPIAIEKYPSARKTPATVVH